MCEEGITREYSWVQQEVSLISAKEGQWLGQMVSIHLQYTRNTTISVDKGGIAENYE